jgi:hypothetical protein
MTLIATNMQMQSHLSFQDFLLDIGQGAIGNNVELLDSMVAMGK